MKKRRSPKPTAKPPLPPKAWTATRVAETAAVPYGAQREQWIAAGEFKARCLELMDHVRDRNEALVITKHGTPVAKLVPFQEAAPSMVGFMQGTILWAGDLMAPIDAEWDALSDEE